MKLVTFRNGALALFCTVVTLVAIAPDANAQDPRRGYNVGVAGQGTDMWTQAMSGLRLFTPHRDNCNTSTEAFVLVYTNSNNVDFGFCIDKDEHSAGALDWEEAKHECLQDGKRLPEPGEYKYACNRAGTLSLNDMTDDAEWSTNFWLIQRKPYSDWWSGVMATNAGSGGCERGGNTPIVRNNSAGSPSLPFRCVR